MTKLIASTPFINVLVKVRPGIGEGVYIVHTAPEVPYVIQPDTVINYQLYDTGGEDIVFTGLTAVPADNDQMSAVSLSKSKKQLTFSDANTAPLTLNITLNFKSPHGEFMHDPQVVNDPQR